MWWWCRRDDLELVAGADDGLLLLRLGMMMMMMMMCGGGADVMILSSWPVQMMVASSVLFTVSDMTCIVNVVYSLSLLFRISCCICDNCCGRDLTADEPR